MTQTPKNWAYVIQIYLIPIVLFATAYLYRVPEVLTMIAPSLWAIGVAGTAVYILNLWSIRNHSGQSNLPITIIIMHIAGYLWARNLGRTGFETVIIFALIMTCYDSFLVRSKVLSIHLCPKWENSQDFWKESIFVMAPYWSGVGLYFVLIDAFSTSFLFSVVASSMGTLLAIGVCSAVSRFASLKEEPAF